MTRRAQLLLCLLMAACTGDEPGSEPVGPAPRGSASMPICAGTTGAHAVLDAFWSAFDERYALFDLRLPDASWDELGRDACAQLDAQVATDGEVTKDELFDVLIGLARHLDDGHTDIAADDIGRDEDAWVSAYPHYDALYELESNAESEYIAEPELSRAAEEEVSWGTIGDVGYLSITSFEGLSPDAASDAGDDDDHAIEDAAADAAMARAMAALRGTRGLIVDVRANEGGWDTVALVVASWFAGPRTLAWSEQRRNGPRHDDFGPWEDVYVENERDGAYRGPVVLLTSGGTFSAGETFVLAMRGRDRVTVLGEPTSGHFSDQLEETLPNGWVIDLSHERYRAADGMIYEARGVPVDEPVALDLTALESGRDTVLDAALARLGG